MDCGNVEDIHHLGRDVDCFFNEDGTYRAFVGSGRVMGQLKAIQDKYPDWNIFIKNSTCSKCGNPMPVPENRIGQVNYCLSCRVEANHEICKRWRGKNKDRIRKNYQKHREYFQDYYKEYYKNNKERCLENSKRFNEKNPGRTKEIFQNWVENNPEKMKEHNRNYYWRKRIAKLLPGLY